MVVNATGVWTDDVQHLVGERGKFKVRASKGVHLVVPRDRMQLDTGLILRTEKSVLFVIPWGRHWIVGTTDTDWELDKAHPAATATDIDYVLEHVNAVLAQPLTREDVEGVYAGLRPLLTGESESTSQLSREHTVAVPVPGPGGRRGRQVHDLPGDGRATRSTPSRAASTARSPPSATHVTPLVGAERLPGAVEPARPRRAAAAACTSARIEHLLRRYGTRIDELLALVARRPRAAASRCRAPTTTWRSRSSTPPRTRARCTSTTCSRGAPGSRSRPGTAALGGRRAGRAR